MSSTQVVYYRCNELINFLKLRGYSRHFLKIEINRTRIIPRQEIFKPQTQKNNSNRTPFVITYNPALPNVSTTVRKNVNIFQSSNRCKQIFPSPPIVAYQWSSNLRDLHIPDLLVRSTLRDCSIQQHLPASQNAIVYAALYLSSFLQTRPSQLH